MMKAVLMMMVGVGSISNAEMMRFDTYATEKDYDNRPYVKAPPVSNLKGSQKRQAKVDFAIMMLTERAQENGFQFKEITKMTDNSFVLEDVKAVGKDNEYVVQMSLNVCSIIFKEQGFQSKDLTEGFPVNVGQTVVEISNSGKVVLGTANSQFKALMNVTCTAQEDLLK